MTDYHNPQNFPKMDIPAAGKGVLNDSHVQLQKTSNDFKGLKNDTGSDEPLTHFHSFFYNLFTWKYPRATASIAVSVVSTILAFHYINVLRYAFKAAYLLFASVALLECAGKPLGVKGFVSQMRPRRYYTIPRESLESIFAELHDLMNFFVVEFQRVVFVENIFTTLMAFLASFVGYFLIKYLPIWGLLLLSTIVAFSAPLVYLNNQEVIDEQLHHWSEVVNEKLIQARDVGEKYAGDAAARAQATLTQVSEKVSSYTVRKTPGSKTSNKTQSATDSPPHLTPVSTESKELGLNASDYHAPVKPSTLDFPNAPTHEPAPPESEYVGNVKNPEYHSEIAA